MTKPRPHSVPKVFRPAPQTGFLQTPPSEQHVEKKESVPHDQQGQASLDSSISEELGAIMDARTIRTKRKRRRGLLITLLIVLVLIGGATGWVVTNPERFDALKGVITEIRSASDVRGMVENYKKALDNIAVRGDQINDATSTMGVDPASVDENAGQGFEQEMSGEDAGAGGAAWDSEREEKLKKLQR